ncbi:MAG: hypothetical protein ABI882_20095, partial [Acidobacteriota bacterium]
YVYRGKNRSDENLVSSFHCIHADRAEVNAFTVKFARRGLTYEVPEITELQFANSKDGHLIP